MRQAITMTREAFPDLHYDIEALVGEDDHVAVLYRWNGTHEGPFAGLPPTGRHVTATGAIVCRLEDGLIVEQWDIDDRLDVMKQLGLVRPADAPDRSP
jgi:predicted ester cyclase